MNRRHFIQKSFALAATSSFFVPDFFLERTDARQAHEPIRISRIKNTLAIAMWDFSWILRHHKFGAFENWDKVLEELAERGYNAVRIDAMPQFVVSTKDGKIIEEFRSEVDTWVPSLWGNVYSMNFRPREALLEFLPKCKKYGIKVGLSTWFLHHQVERDVFMEEGGLFRAWDETLEFLQKHGLLDNVIYVDLLNEYPIVHGYDWFKNELNKRSRVDEFKLNNPDANIPDETTAEEWPNRLQKQFYNNFYNDLKNQLKQKYRDLDFFVSLPMGAMELNQVDLTNFDTMDCHVWFQHHRTLPGLDPIRKKDLSYDYRKQYDMLITYWRENKQLLTDWMDSRLSEIASSARNHGIFCGNTEGWGAIQWFDHPDLGWDWIKECAEIAIDLAKKHDEYKFLCTSNFTHPQFKGMWRDLKWHRKVTDRIKS